MTTTQAQQRPSRTEGWSRRRGFAAGIVAVAVVAVALFLSRVDLANEVAAVRSQLSAANQELAEDQREIDELEDAARQREEEVTACRDTAELGEGIRRALDVLQRGLVRGDTGLVAKGVAQALRDEEAWAEATDACLQATQEEEGQG